MLSASAPLGITAKSVHAGEGRESAKQGAYLGGRALRYQLTRRAGSLLYDRDKLPGDQSRVCWCHRTIRTKGGSVFVYRSADASAARLSGVTTCGSVWACPVCAGKIAEGRREELQRGMIRWIGEGGHVFLLTLTFPHDRGEFELADQLARFDRARKRFSNSRAYKGTMARYGRAGSVRSLEVTHGANDWHPHVHELVFAGPGLDGDSASIDALRSSWVDCLIREGLGDHARMNDMLAHALDLRGGAYAADYVTKFGKDSAWGISAELTKSHAKIGSRRLNGLDAHYTPFQLLAWADRGDVQAGQLFREYAIAFEGKRMLTWSPRLKAKLAIDEATDDELADRELPEQLLVGELHEEAFAIVQSRNALGELIDYAATCCTREDTGQADLDDFIEALRRRPATHGAALRRSTSQGGGVLFAPGSPALEYVTAEIH